MDDNSQPIDIHTDEAWVSVIQKMDEAYADLVRTQVEVENKNAELEQAQSFSDSIKHAMNDVLIACNHKGEIESVNRALEQVTGLSEAELVNMSFTQLLDDKDRITFLHLLDQIGQEPMRDIEFAIHGSNEIVTLSINCSPRHDHRGRLLGVVLVGRPLGELQRAYKELNEAHAELKLAQERLVQSEKMASLGRLVAGVAHELNNPISFVYGNMHALERYTSHLTQYFDAINEGYSREDLRAMRETMRLDKIVRDLSSLVEGTKEGADRVKEIVNDLRQFSSTQSFERAPFDLVHVIRSALHWILKESKADIHLIDNLPDKALISGHSGQIHQVVVNLIQNAVDAMQDTPQKDLIVSVQKTKSLGRPTLALTIRDTGSGIAEDSQQRVFEPFFTTKPVGQGTGLGLSISYGIVAQHNGHLSVTNHAQGGAEAKLELPDA